MVGIKVMIVLLPKGIRTDVDIIIKDKKTCIYKYARILQYNLNGWLKSLDNIWDGLVVCENQKSFFIAE